LGPNGPAELRSLAKKKEKKEKKRRIKKTIRSRSFLI
jgi:hypothetical protein